MTPKGRDLANHNGKPKQDPLVVMVKQFAHEGRISASIKVNEWAQCEPIGEFAAECCRGIRGVRSGVHFITASHFRQWAKENPDALKARFPEAVQLLAEELLIGQRQLI
jgi:hypothetical protein